MLWRHAFVIDPLLGFVRVVRWIKAGKRKIMWFIASWKLDAIQIITSIHIWGLHSYGVEERAMDLSVTNHNTNRKFG